MWSYHWPPEFSGAALQARRLSHVLRGRGWEVWALVSTGDHARVAETEDDGLRVVRVPRSRLRRFTPMALQTLWRYSRALRARRHEFDVLHLHTAYMDAALGATLAQWWGKPCIVKNTLPGVDLQQYGHGLWGRWQKRALDSAGAFVGASPAAADELVRIGIPPEKIHRIPNGVDTEHFYPSEPGERPALRAKLGLHPEGRLILNHSGLTARKGTDALVEAFAIEAARDPHLQLALVGPWERDGQPLEGDAPSWLPNLRRRIGELGLTERIHMPGAQSNTVDWLRAADAFAFPSQNDLLPNSVLEAMATALPIVTWDVPFAQALLREGESGLLVKPGDVEGFAGAIAQILSDPDQARRLGTAARKSVCEVYSLDRVATAYEELYQSLS
jgi:glycosyltransferase involved in cell wall biosynthesis